MAMVWLAARAALRRRFGATVAVTVLVGLAGGVVLAAVAGASRSDSAMDRFLAYSRPDDLVVVVNGASGDPSDPAVVAHALATRARVQSLPEIAHVGRDPYLFMSPDPSGDGVGDINPFAAADDEMFRTIDRPLLLRGRLARPDRPDEAVVDDLTAAQRGVEVGDRVPMWAFSRDQIDAVAGNGSSSIPPPAGPTYSFHVVGIVRDPTTVDVPPAGGVRSGLFGRRGGLYLTPAFLRRFAHDEGTIPEALPGMEMFRVRLRDGLAGLPGFERALRRVVEPGDGQVHVGSDLKSAADATQRPMHLEATALLLFAVLAGLAATLVLGFVVARQAAADADDNERLAALGVGPRQLVLVPLVGAGIVAAAGAALAVVVATALSRFTPIGLARRAEVETGVSVNVTVFVLGFTSIVVLVMGRALVTSWRAAHTARRHGPAPGDPLATALAGASLGPSAAAGVSMASERRRGLAPRVALLAVAVAGVVAALTFGFSLRRLVDSPAEQGWNWDVIVGNPNSDAIADEPAGVALHDDMVRKLTANPAIAAFSGRSTVDGTTVDGRAVPLAAVERHKGSVLPIVVEGRFPASGHEIALGRDVLRDLHKGVGDAVTVRSGDRRATMRIVGSSLQPTAGDLSPRLSTGGVVAAAALRPLGVHAGVFEFAVRYRAGVDEHDALGSLVEDFGDQVLEPYPGGEIGDLARVDGLPFALAGLLGVLSAGAFILVLVGWIRHHRRDVAILRTIGFVRGQVAATVAWQATVLVVAALLVGIPSGVALGRWTWRLVADGVGSVMPPVVPVAGVLAAAVVGVLLAELLAGSLGWVAGGARPAAVLRTE